MKKLSEVFSEQHREKGRFKPTIPRMVSSTPVASPRPTSDSADVRLKEYLQQQDPEDLRGTSSGAVTLLDKPNKEPMRKYKEMKINELSNELLHRYKEKAAIDASKADREGNFERGTKRFSGVVKATNKQFANFKKKGFREESEVNEAKDDKREYDYEGEMVKSDLRSIIANANRLIDMLEDNDNLPEWCQNKVTLAEDYISTVANYMTAEMNEEVEYLEEKNKPTNPELWARAKALAKSKFDVYPSAYANGWASKWYKSKGGGWRSVSEEVEQLDELKKSTLASYAMKAADQARNKKDAAIGHVRQRKGLVSSGEIEKSNKADKRIEGVKGAIKRLAKEETKQVDEMNMSPHKQAVVAAGGGTPADQGVYAAQREKPPFEGGAKTKDKVIPGKHGKGYSTARHLARMAMQKQVQGMKKMPVKEETRKAAIVKEVMKKKKNSDDAFQKDPELSTTLTKV